MTHLLRIFFIAIFPFFFLLSPSLVSAQEPSCIQEIDDQSYGWLPYPTPHAPTDITKFYPWVDKTYPKNTQLDFTMIPNPESVECMAYFAKKHWSGSKFDQNHVNQVISFAQQNNWNPSLLLALWLEETHAGAASVLEFGCGSAQGFDAQLNCLAGIDPKYKNNTFACFLGSYAGDTPLSLNCGYGDPDNAITNPEFYEFIQYYNYLTQGVKSSLSSASSTIPATQFDFHPLRPFPDNPAGTTNEDFLTHFCAMRPLPVQLNRYDKRDETIDIITVGNLTQDFTNFITPLMSITNPDKPDYSLPFSDKAQRYLADYLEGRAYYEPLTENPQSDDIALQSDLFNRLGVFRKLAPKSYQDKLKKALIFRAVNAVNPDTNPYGFTPASATVHNYIVGYWHLGQAYASNHNQGEKVTLKDYYTNKAWAPLADEYDSHIALASASAEWQLRDGGSLTTNLDGTIEKKLGKWAALWPYVPMFTREDSTGYIQVFDSNGVPFSVGTGYVEENKTQDKKNPVNHPHLARAYEVSTSLSYMLTPTSVHEAETPELYTESMFKAWEDSPWWLDPSLMKPKPPQVPKYPILGPLCTVDPNFITPIYSSGDLAHNDIFTTQVNRQDLNVPDPPHESENPFTPPVPCGSNSGAEREYPCEKCVEKLRWDVQIVNGRKVRVRVVTYSIDESACFYYKRARSNPNYLVTYTPFLDEILTSTTQSQRGIFDILKPYGTEKQLYEEYDWPGLGNLGEESPVYEYTGGGEGSWAEAGLRYPGDTQSYYYRYLGSIQCAKERVLQHLQPFLTGQPYEPYAYDCFPELEPPPGQKEIDMATDPGLDYSSNLPASYDIGQITSTCANISDIFIHQSNPAWANTLSPNRQDLKKCTIGLCGCGSSSTAMILNSFGSNTNVTNVWNQQHRIGGYQYTNKYCLTIHSGPMEIFANAGLSITHIGSGSNADWKEAEKFLENCSLIYATGDAHWPSGYVGGHVIVISEIIRDTGGKPVAIKTLDPGTSKGNGLIRTLGSKGDYAYETRGLWAISP